MSGFRIEELSKDYGSGRALGPVDLEFPEAGITAVLGPSGCGKTTLLRVLAGLTRPDAGRVVLGGAVANDPASRIPAERRGVGMVFQDALLWPHLRVRGNIAFPLGPGRRNDPRVEEAPGAAEIDGFLDRYPAQLSGGERRRVAVARAIVGRPSLLLLDEPLTGLDANLRIRLLATIRRIHRDLGVTTVYVTHDQEEALGIADQVVVMRSGRILQSGPPGEVYSRPRTAFVAGFVGLSAVLSGGNGGLLAVRPETVRLSGEGEPAVVRAAMFHGERWLLTLQAEAGELLAWSEGPRETGDEVRFRLSPEPVPVLDDREVP